MKKNILLSLCIIIAFGQVIRAQFKSSIGIETILPIGKLGEISSFGVGFSGNDEYLFSNKIGLTSQVGFIHFFPKEGIKSAFTVPLQMGLKYYIDSNDKGFYLQGQIGIHVLFVQPEDNRNTDIPFLKTPPNYSYNKYLLFDFSYAIGCGYLLTKNLDLGLRYNIINTSEKPSSYIGLNLNYNFLTLRRDDR